MIKLVATDLDGTMFDSKGQIPQSAKEAIQKYSKKGVHFAFCTGRGFMGVEEVIERFPYIEYAITANGAYAFNTWTKQDIYKIYIKPEDCHIIFSVLREKDALFELYQDGKIYCDKKFKNEKYNYIPAKFDDLINAPRELVDDMDNFIKNMKKGAIKIHSFFATTTVRDITFDEIKNLPYEIISQSMNELEINEKGVNKGFGIESLAKKLNIKKSEILALGDNSNDTAMRNTSGTLVAMGNAVKQLKDIADFVTKSNDDGGMAFALDKFLS